MQRLDIHHEIGLKIIKKKLKLGVIGLGLIGGSMALGLKKNGLAEWICGFDQHKDHRNTALELGIVDEITSLKQLSETQMP
jgi:prephenate dehydrogenase